MAEKFGENLASRPSPARSWIIECSVAPRYAELLEALRGHFQDSLAEEEVVDRIDVHRKDSVKVLITKRFKEPYIS